MKTRPALGVTRPPSSGVDPAGMAPTNGPVATTQPAIVDALLVVDSPQVGDLFLSLSSITGRTSTDLVGYRLLAGGQLLAQDSLVELIAAEVDGHKPGADIVVSRLTEALISRMRPGRSSVLPAALPGRGRLAGALRDSEISASLGLIHGQPAHSWSAQELAAAVGLSRSTFFKRFKRLVGETPAQYLTRWRIHLATRMLRDEGASVTAAARRLGYATDAAFSNAFLRVMGVRPGAYRRAA